MTQQTIAQHDSFQEQLRRMQSAGAIGQLDAQIQQGQQESKPRKILIAVTAAFNHMEALDGGARVTALKMLHELLGEGP